MPAPKVGTEKQLGRLHPPLFPQKCGKCIAVYFHCLSIKILEVIPESALPALAVYMFTGPTGIFGNITSTPTCGSPLDKISSADGNEKKMESQFSKI